MPKSKWNLNTIYISERLQESLRPISRCAMTAVVAPMGYGKTTEAEQTLSMLTEQNAFVTRLPDGVSYRFHHMMKECSERSFLTLNAQTQRLYWERFGRWHEEHRQYLHALAAYRKSENFDALLRVVEKDAGILLTALDPQTVLDDIGACPVSTLKAHPLALLVLMRSMFNWRNIPKMKVLKELLLTAIREHPELSAEERGNLLGECDLIMSFLCYNDISGLRTKGVHRMRGSHRDPGDRCARPYAGSQSRTCSRCGNIETAAIARLPHTFSPVRIADHMEGLDGLFTDGTTLSENMIILRECTECGAAVEETHTITRTITSIEDTGEIIETYHCDTCDKDLVF